MLRSLGSFPYTLSTTQNLELSVLRTAVIILVRRDDSMLRINTSGASAALHSAGVSARKRRVLFQSLAAHQTEPSEKILRSKEDHGDLLEALAFLGQYNYVTSESNMSCKVRGPPIPSAESFPSSWSRKLDGKIPYEDFEALVRLLLVAQSDRAVVNMQRSTKSVDEIDNVATSVCNAFVDDGEDVGWEAFDRVLASSMPNLFNLFPRILGPLVLPKLEIQPRLQSAQREEAASLLRSTFSGPDEAIFQVKSTWW